MRTAPITDARTLVRLNALLAAVVCARASSGRALQWPHQPVAHS